MSAATKYRYKDLPKNYEALVDILPPRPIHTESEYDEVCEIMDVLAIQRRLTKDQHDYLEALSRFIEDYDDLHVHFEDPFKTPLEALQYLMEQSGLTVTKLGQIIGDKSVASRVLSGQRQLSKAHIKRLCEQFKVEPGYFLR